MSASQTRSPTPQHLEDFVGAPCHVTRMGWVYDGRGTLLLPDVNAHWLRCPEVGKPMWLLVGDDNWVRTSPVESIVVDGRAHNVVSVRTHGARYRFVFNHLAAANRE